MGNNKSSDHLNIEYMNSITEELNPADSIKHCSGKVEHTHSFENHIDHSPKVATVETIKSQHTLISHDHANYIL